MWEGWENIWEGSPKARVQSQLSEACNRPKAIFSGRLCSRSLSPL